jgi:phage tail sheath protein FI
MWSKPSTFFACLRPPEDPEYFALYRQAAEYCEKRRALLLAEPPRDSTVADARGWIETIGVGLARRNVAAFYAGLLVAEAGRGEVTKVPCTGAVAGVLARNDATRGVWRTAAGTTATIAGALGLARDLSEDEVRSLDTLAVNCLRGFPATGPVIWGDRTLAGAVGSDDEFKYLPVRRLALFIEQSIAEGTRWVAFEPNGPALWGWITAVVTAFLHRLFAEGAFAGATPGESCFVRCDSTMVSEADVEAGIINIVVGIAPLRPPSS